MKILQPFILLTTLMNTVMNRIIKLRIKIYVKKTKIVIPVYKIKLPIKYLLRQDLIF